MDLRIGWMPVCLAMLLGVFTLHSIPAQSVENLQQELGLLPDQAQQAVLVEDDQVATRSQWVIPKSLIRDLEALPDNPEVTAWAETTINVLQQLKSLDGLSDPSFDTIYQQLEQQRQQLDFVTVQVSTIPVQEPEMAQGKLATRLRHIRYALQRRLDIWSIVYDLSQYKPAELDRADDGQAARFLLASATRLNTAGMDKGWVEYLMLNEAASIFNSVNAKAFNKREAARAVLARLHSPALSNAQRKYLGEAIDPTTLNVLKSAASQPIDLGKLLQRIERDELSRNGATAYYVNNGYQDLLWSSQPEYWRLAEGLQQHYRNANFRVSVSEELLNQMIPQRPDTREPYRDKFLGATVRGQNRISNQIRISLIPDPRQISLRLETLGSVDSRTTATKSGVVVENVSNSRFSIMKRLAFGQQGIFEYRPQTSSRVRQRVVGLQTNMDGIPPLGWIVRKIARNKIEQQAPAARRYTQNQLESSVESRFEQEISQHLDELETMLTEKLLHPLVAIDLEPEPLEIQTTGQRINLRYRLAGRDQMAAATPRPRAVQSCLMSMQIHESAINNLMSRFDFASRKFDSQELVQYINTIFRSDFVIDDGKSRKPAEFEFAPFDPIRIDFEEQQMVVSVNLKSFRIGSGKRWKNLNVRAIYEPRMEDGFRLRLTQSEEGLRIKGKRLNAADQIAIGLICEILFPDQFEVALMPANVAKQLNLRSVQATQFVVSNGWIGLSVDNVSPTVDAKPTQTAERSRKLIKRPRR